MRVGLGLYAPLESKTPRPDAGRKSKTGSRKRPYSRRRRVRAPDAGPRADCGHGDAVAARRSTALAQPTPFGARKSWGRRLLARRSYWCENWWDGCPLRRLTQTSGSRSRDRHGVIGEMRNRSATAAPAIETSPAASAGFPQEQLYARPDRGATRHAQFVLSDRLVGVDGDARFPKTEPQRGPVRGHSSGRLTAAGLTGDSSGSA
jgi:hypothetical protein